MWKMGECIKESESEREWENGEFRAESNITVIYLLLSAVNYLVPTIKQAFYTHLVGVAKQWSSYDPQGQG